MTGRYVLPAEIQVFVLVICCAASVLAQQQQRQRQRRTHDIGRNYERPESLEQGRSLPQFSAASPSSTGTIVPSRQETSKVTFGDEENRESNLNHVNHRFQEQRLQVGVYSRNLPVVRSKRMPEYQCQSARFQDSVAQPYDFGYSIQDDYGNNQYRQETSDGSGVVRGSYGYTDALGIYRKVKYIADADGFRAEVSSNEPGVKGESPASASFIVEAPPQSFQPERYPSAEGSRRPSARRRFPQASSALEVAPELSEQQSLASR